MRVFSSAGLLAFAVACGGQSFTQGDNGGGGSTSGGTGGAAQTGGSSETGGSADGGSAGQAGQGGGSGGASTDASVGTGGLADAAVDVGCGSGLTQCGSACVGLGTDPAHCGACGHDCLGGKCTSGLCAPVVVASGQAGPQAIAVDVQNIYWANHDDGHVFAAGKSGASLTVLMNGLVKPDAIAVDSQSIYTTQEISPPVETTPAAGGGPVTSVSTVPFGAVAMAVDATDVYWISASDLFRTGKTGGASLDLLSGQVGAWAMVVDDLFVYATFSTGELRKIAKTGNTTSVLWRGTQPRGIALTTSHACLVDSSAGTVLRVPKIGGPSETLASGQGGPTGIAAEPGWVYWTNYVAGTVMKVSLTNLATTKLAASQVGPWGIAVDATTVYWTNRDGGQVMKVAK
jgi:hypothetical protein